MSASTDVVRLQCCLNGTRGADENPAVPMTAQACAIDAAAVVQAGATDLHIHPRLADGRDSIDPTDVAAWVQAVRDAVTVPVGVTTGAWAWSGRVSAPQAIGAWTVLPDHASVNWHESTARQVAEVLHDRGVRMHVGLWTESDVHSWLESPWVDRTDLLLLELPDAPDQIPVAERMLELVRDTGRDIVVHGEDRSAWPIFDWAAGQGVGLRIGLEDTLITADGELADDNVALVREATRRRSQAH